MALISARSPDAEVPRQWSMWSWIKVRLASPTARSTAKSWVAMSGQGDPPSIMAITCRKWPSARFSRVTMAG